MLDLPDEPVSTLTDVLEITTLGGLSVRSNGKLVSGFVSRKAEALLVYLASTHRPHSREILADLLWDDRSTDQALSNLRTVLASLRKQLKPYIESTHQLVGLEFEKVWFDATELDAALVLAAKEWRKEGLLSQASTLKLEQILALYRGNFLEGFSVYDSQGFEEWLMLERERLQQAVIEGFDHLVESYLAHAMYDQAIGQARRLIQLDSLREEAYFQLMTALALTGQRTAALEQYAQCQRVLETELGIAPSQELTELYGKIQVGSLAPAQALQQPEQHAAAIPRHTLPQQATPFIGRSSELLELETRFTDPSCRLLTIVGPGGIGKTRLSLQFANIHGTAFPDGVYFVSLAPLNTPASIGSAIAEAIHFTFYPQGDPRRQLLDYLRSKTLLLVLDNVEHLLSGIDIVADILRVAPNVRIVATSRERLNLDGENLFRIQSLECPDWETPEDALEYSSMQLFMQSARRVNADFAVTQDNLKDLVRICRLVDGMPLGILLAAAWVEVLSLREIVKEIETNLNFLEVDQRDLPQRQRSMRLAFDYSWNLLSDSERGAFKNLSVFRGGFTREAASSVANASLKVLMTLVNKSLLRRESHTGRYDVHELLRQFAQEHLYASVENRNSILDAHCRYYADLMSQQWEAMKTERLPVALDEIENEIDNIRAAWHWMIERHNIPAIQKTMFSLWKFFSLRSQYQEAVALFSEAVNAVKTAPTDEETLTVLAHLLAFQGRFLIAAGDPQNGKDAIDHCVAVLPLSAKPQDRLVPLESLSQAALASGQNVKAWQAATEALQAARAIPDQWEVAWLLYWLGMVTLARENYEEVQEIARASLQIAANYGDTWLNACLYTFLLGGADVALNAYAEARKHFKQGLAFYEKLGQPWGISVSYWNLGNVAYRSGDYQESEGYYCQSLKILDRTGQTHLSFAVLYDLVKAYVAQRKESDALQILEFMLQQSAIPRDTRDHAQALRDTLLMNNPSIPASVALPNNLTFEQILAQCVEI